MFIQKKTAMSEFKRTQIVDYKQTNGLSADNIYWKRLDFPITNKEFGFINGLDFSPVAPYNFAVSHSTKVDIYDPSTNLPCGSLTRFKKNAYGNSFRRDGKLIVVGGEDAQVKLFSVDSKSQLRSFKGHESAVHWCKFLLDNQSIVSFSDDRTVRCWDIATAKQISLFAGHSDYVRCGVTSQRADSLVVSGSYDHTVRVWDTRNGQSVLTLDHGYPVESVIMFPNDSLIVSAGGTVLKVWDIASAGRQLVQLSQHHKTITCLCFSSQNRRILSSSLDRHVKIYDAATYQVVHTLDYPAAVVKIGVSGDDETVVAAMTDGLLSIQHRQPEKDPLVTKIKRNKVMSYRYVIHKSADIKFKNDLIVKDKNVSKLANYDQYLRTFQHTKALDAVLSHFFTAKRPEVTISVIRELTRRRALRKALAGRSDEALQPVIALVISNISRVPFASTMMDVANDLIDLYTDKVNELNDKTKRLLKKMNNAVNLEVGQMREMLMIKGSLDLVRNSTPYVETEDRGVETLRDLLNAERCKLTKKVDADLKIDKLSSTSTKEK